ncbi:MAG: leucine-rich repeat domain-containing protein, partial [Lachnospiraceae bacterium]
TTTTQTIKAGLEVKTSEAEYVINTDKKTVTYEQPVSTASKSANIVIPDSIKINNKTYKVTSIAPRAYANNKAVQKITIGKNVTSIGKEAFKSCTSLQAVAGGSQVKTINQGAFYGCNRLTQVSFPGVTNVKEKAFASCKKLSSVVFGKQLTTIGKKVFDKDSALKNIYIKSTKVKKVDKTSLSGVPKSTKLYLPSSKKKTYSKLFQSAKVKKKYVKFK